ncbi:4Fe-4S dicluster domain-containing protein [Geobacter benzoatilyticus]|uniref:4Fe-4S dicluster domain-containing protein n=1 Tax=Geobacter benzoatilyticus TaxID=2815309 RepID=A0ABX7Q5F8_9BACT|nr:4Fe-4S dicluster domain-containing protein [Geobacter benzoatilyticus]QSV46674.1 4Fe-4S dicluster domain-containing protein [Geobacter benzoatilyticus]
MNRREFLKRSMVIVAGMAVPAAALELIDPKRLLAARPELRWAFLADAYKCVGCGFCVKACKLENEVPYEANVSRTWVERYVVKKDGEVLIDSPKAARDGFITKKIEVGDGKYREVKDEEIEKAFFVPKLCNQCENPPCVQVCPVGATYATADGVVLVDRKWCIGCGYCIMGCPYGVRFFHPVHKVAEKCNFCYHRITRGMKPACVDACPFGARQIGNLRDPDDPVTRIIMTERVGILKEEYGTKPQVYYIGLSREVR